MTDFKFFLGHVFNTPALCLKIIIFYPLETDAIRFEEYKDKIFQSGSNALFF